MVRWLTSVLIGAAAAGACADVRGPWVVWDARLDAVSGRPAVIEGRRVRLVDQHGLDVAVDDAVAMLRLDERPDGGIDDGSWSASNAWEALVTLTDGQRWEANIVDDADSEDLELRVRLLGRVSVPLDVVRSVVLGEGSGEREWAEVFDRVVLDNGDVLTGTVLAIGRMVEIEGDDGLISVERDAVRRIGLVNPDSGAAPMRLWFSSGSVFGARSIAGGETVAFEAVAPTADAGAWRDLGRVDGTGGGSALVGVEFAPGRLMSISSLEVVGVEAEGERRWTPRPTVARGGQMGQDALVLPGPMAARLALPRRGVRASGVLTLGDRAGAWSDCIVRIEQDGELLWEGRLTRSDASAAFSVGLGSSRELTVRVLSGAYGPVQDRVELRLGWVLLAERD